MPCSDWLELMTSQRLCRATALDIQHASYFSGLGDASVSVFDTLLALSC